MINNLNFSQLTAEAHAHIRLRHHMNMLCAAVFAVMIVAFFFTSSQDEPSSMLMVGLGLSIPLFALLYLLVIRSSIGWGVMLYIFRPSQRVLLREFPPAKINWFPFLLMIVGFISFIALMFGNAWGALVVAAIVISGGITQMLTLNALNRGDYAAVERYTAFAARWLPYPNFFGHRLVALINAQRFDEAIAMTTERLAYTPRLAPPLSETLHGQALALGGANRYDEALTAAEKALQLSPDTASIYMTLADYYLRHVKNPATALEILDAAQPFLGAFAYNWRLFRARTYAELGRFNEANADLTEAGKMSTIQHPEHVSKASLLFTTVAVKCHEGDLNAARAAYDELVRIDIDGTQAMSARKILNEFV